MQRRQDLPVCRAHQKRVRRAKKSKAVLTTTCYCHLKQKVREHLPLKRIDKVPHNARELKLSWYNMLWWFLYLRVLLWKRLELYLWRRMSSSFRVVNFNNKISTWFDKYLLKYCKSWLVECREYKKYIDLKDPHLPEIFVF